MKNFFKKNISWLSTHKAITIVSIFLISIYIALPCVYFTWFYVPFYSGEDRKSVGILPDEYQLKKAIKYEHIIIFGIDAAGDYFKHKEYNEFHRIFDSGSISYTCMSQRPTISAQNWASMLTGMQAHNHQITNIKAYVFTRIGKYYPTVFKLYGDAHQDKTMSSICDWEPINHGIIEKNINNIAKINAKDTAKNGKITDEVTRLAINRVNNYNDSIMFLHFDEVDDAGHSSGYGSTKYANSIKNIDTNIGKIYDACNSKWGNNVLYILATDHGHTLTGGHGGESNEEKMTTLAVNGGLNNIIKGTPEKCVTQDVASIILYALGEKQIKSMDSKVPFNIFTTLT